MLNALALFDQNIDRARNLAGIYDYLKINIQVPLSFDDLLRSQIMYSVSAFDKLMHDLIRIGMVEIYTGVRQPTPKYLSESLTMEVHSSLVTATVPPKEYVFEQALFQKLKFISFQDPSKVSDGLSYIWNTSNKWQQIAGRMAISEDQAKKKLSLIVSRRNAIVHESDVDPLTRTKIPIQRSEAEDTTAFLHRCGTEITGLVR